MRGPRPIRVVAPQPRRQSATPASTTPISIDRPARGPLTLIQPPDQGDEDDLHVWNDGAEPGAHERDRLVPQIEIGGEKETADERQQSARGGRDGRRPGRTAR